MPQIGRRSFWDSEERVANGAKLLDVGSRGASGGDFFFFFGSYLHPSCFVEGLETQGLKRSVRLILGQIHFSASFKFAVYPLFHLK